MSKPVFIPGAKIRVVSDGTIPRNTIVSIGNVAIPWRELDIQLRLDEFIELTMVVRPDDIDIEVLQEQTRVEVVTE